MGAREQGRLDVLERRQAGPDARLEGLQLRAGSPSTVASATSSCRSAAAPPAMEILRRRPLRAQLARERHVQLAGDPADLGDVVGGGVDVAGSTPAISRPIWCAFHSHGSIESGTNRWTIASAVSRPSASMWCSEPAKAARSGSRRARARGRARPRGARPAPAAGRPSGPPARRGSRTCSTGRRRALARPPSPAPAPAAGSAQLEQAVHAGQLAAGAQRRSSAPPRTPRPCAAPTRGPPGDT